MDNDHGITGELREWFKDRIFMANGWQELHDIADRIDAAYHAAYQDGENAILAVLDKRGDSDVDKTMDEHGWYRALDADKKPIRLGDEVYQVEGGLVYTVESITFYPNNTTVSFGCKHGFGCDNAHNVHHYHAPTVEDVLREFGDWYAHTKGGCDEEAIIAEYAAKLRLAGGDAE